MSATADSLWESIEVALDALPEGCEIVLSDLSWEEYEQLFEETMDQVHFKMYYSDGKFVVTSRSFRRETVKSLFPALIMVLAEELEQNFIPSGGASLKNAEKKKGADPDESYYFANADKRIHLPADPPPDLLIEADISNPVINKSAIYAALGVPEFWQYKENKLRFYQLENADYFEVNHSSHFRFVSPAVITEFLRQGQEEGTITMVKAYREWVKANKPA